MTDTTSRSSAARKNAAALACLRSDEAEAGSAQTGRLTSMFGGVRPNAAFNPMHKEGAIGLGEAGDNSNSGQGNFFEGVMTAHYSSDAADDAVQANIVSIYGQ